MWTRTKLLSALLALANLVRGGKESNSTIHSSIFQPSRLLGPIVLSTHHWAALLVASTLSLPRSPLPATFRCDPFETAINFSSFSFVLSPVNFTRYVFDFLSAALLTRNRSQSPSRSPLAVPEAALALPATFTIPWWAAMTLPPSARHRVLSPVLPSSWPLCWPWCS